jgi:transposase
MSMGNHGGDQETLFVTHKELRGPGHPFYRQVNKLLAAHSFDKYVEGLCRKFYVTRKGRPSVPPGVYFRCLLLGYFEGIDSERGIAWRVADSLSLRDFLGIPAGRSTLDHSTLSKTRIRIDVETHREVFTWVLGILTDKGLAKGKTIGVDGTTLEANAAMKSIERRDDGRTYQEFLGDLAKASGIDTPTREQLARLDRKRKEKKTSNDDWFNPNDPDAQVTKMKDGRTHMGHKQEHAVDLDSGAIVAVTITGGAVGDTTSVGETMERAADNLADAAEKASSKNQKKLTAIEEIVTDKGYHGNDALGLMTAALIRTYISEPARGRRKWKGDLASRDCVYANRRRIRGVRGRRLMRLRGELTERTFAHALDTGGRRRVHLRGHENILKRVLVHIAGFNLGLVMRAAFGFGKPRCFQGRLAALWAALIGLIHAAIAILGTVLARRGDLAMDQDVAQNDRLTFAHP